MNETDFLVFAAPDIQEPEIEEVEACMRSGWLGTGPRVARFEQDFAAYQGLKPTQVAGLNSCTAALHVSMVAANLEPGSEVITTPLTNLRRLWLLQFLRDKERGHRRRRHGRGSR